MLRSDFVLVAPLGTGTRDLYRGRGCSVKWLPAMWTLITQLITLKQGYQGVVTTIDDDVKFIYGHAKVFAENDSVKGLLRSPFKDRIKTIVIDEAHFIIQW